MLAGLVSFLSPCVLPLVPGYVSYTTGLVGADLAESKRGRVLAGTVLFVLGFTVVFVSFGALFGALGALLFEYRVAIQRVLGVLTIVMGLAFMGWLPWASREWRIHRMPTLGLLGAPLLGVLFGLGWTPCIGPTLAAVQTLALNEASAWRGAILTASTASASGCRSSCRPRAAPRGRRGGLGEAPLLLRHGARRRAARAARVLLLTGVWNDLVRMTVWAAGYQVSI